MLNIDEMQCASAGNSPNDQTYGGKASHPLPVDCSTPTTNASFLHHQHQQQQQFLHYSSHGTSALTSQASLTSTASPLSGDGAAEEPRSIFCSSVECSVKTEPNSERKLPPNPAVQRLSERALSYESLSNRATDKLYPLVIAEYYMNPILFIDDNKEKVTAQCKRCARPVTGWWSPRLVTSNFITHLKSCSVELYQHFLETKKRCGWTARRYTVKLRADANVVAPWKSDSGVDVTNGTKPNFGVTNESYEPDGKLSEGANSLSEGRSSSEEAPVLYLEACGEFGSERPSSGPCPQRSRISGLQAHVLRSLSAFAAEEMRPPGHLMAGPVERLLLRFGVRLEMPSEEGMRGHLKEHHGVIKSMAFGNLPPLDKSSILLGIHTSVKRDCLSCIVCYWSCSINAGQLNKRLFSIRRYGNLETALQQASDDILNAKAFQHSLANSNERPTGSEMTSQEPVLVISRNPSSYLRIPSFGKEGHIDLTNDIILPPKLGGLPHHRLVDDVPRQLWTIFTSSIRRIELLARLLDLALEHLGAAAMEPGSPIVEPGECTGFTTQLRLLSCLTTPLTIGKGYELFKLLETSLGHDGETLYASLVALLSMGQYFASAVQRLHGRGVTISNFLPLLLGLQKKVGTAESACEPSLVTNLRQVVVGQLESAMNHYGSSGEDGDASLFLLATFADPQYKLFWVEDTDQEKIYREKIIKFLGHRLPKVTSSAGSTVQPEHAEVDDGLLDFVAKRRRMAISEAGCEWPLVDEVNNYLMNKDVGPALEFWASERRQSIFPNIFKLHKEVHSVAVSCFDACLDTGLSTEQLSEATGQGAWARESDDIFEILALAKCYGYDFSGRAKSV